MTVDEIKAAVDAGKAVCWSNSGYRVIKDSKGQYLIKCLMNDSTIGLTWRDNVTLNGEEEDFFVLNSEPLKECYQCEKPVPYLFDDSRCKDCTRLTPSEIRGDV